MLTSKYRCLWILVLVLQAAHADNLFIFAAISLTDALQEIAPAFEQAEGHQCRFNFDSSGNLARQIEAGAPADLFFSADQAKMDRLQKQQLIQIESRQSILSNTLVLIAHRDSAIKSDDPEQLMDPAIRKIAIGNPETVPCGTYAKAWLEKRGLWDGLQSKLVPTENVRAVLAVVNAGNADAGLVYNTDAALAHNIIVLFRVPPDECPDISYPIAICRSTAHTPAAQSFINYLRSPTAESIFTQYGFTLLKR